MKGLRQHTGTRRQLFRVIAASAASLPFLALPRKSAAQTATTVRRPVHCLLKGTGISTPTGYRPVQELQIGDEVQTLAGRKSIKWIGYNKFTKEQGRAWQDSVMPIRVARFAIDDHTTSLRSLSLAASLYLLQRSADSSDVSDQ